jgi:hypothetical protein
LEHFFSKNWVLLVSLLTLPGVPLVLRPWNWPSCEMRSKPEYVEEKSYRKNVLVRLKAGARLYTEQIDKSQSRKEYNEHVLLRAEWRLAHRLLGIAVVKLLR